MKISEITVGYLYKKKVKSKIKYKMNKKMKFNQLT